MQALNYVSLNDNLLVMISHGYQAFTVMDSIRYKILRRLKFWYELDRTEIETIGAICIRLTNGTRKNPMFCLQYTVMQLAARGIGFTHRFGRKWLFIGYVYEDNGLGQEKYTGGQSLQEYVNSR